MTAVSEPVPGPGGPLGAERHVRPPDVAVALAHRSLLGTVRIPATVIPTIVMPIFFTIAFSGAFSALTDLPVFPAEHILDWMVPFAVLQGAAFAGFGAAYGVGRDLENGFYDRLLLAPTPRAAVVAGPILYSVGRAFLPLVTVVPIGVLAGARLRGGVAGVVLLVLAAVGVAVCAALWGLGVIYRARSQRAAALVQIGIFVAQFLSVGQVPLEAMEGTWLHPFAAVNPMTHVLGMGRQAFLGDVSWADTWPGLAAIAVTAALLGVFAYRGFRKLTP